MEEKFYTYIVRCADGSLYTGWTTDLEKRIRAHNGEIKGGAKYTRGRDRSLWCGVQLSVESKMLNPWNSK